MGRAMALSISMILIFNYLMHLLPSHGLWFLLICCALVLAIGFANDRVHRRNALTFRIFRLKSRGARASAPPADPGSSVPPPDKTNERRLLTLVEESADFIGLAEQTGRYVYMNRAFLDEMGMDEAAAGKLYLFDRHPESERAMLEEIAWPEALRGGSWTGESRLRNGKGEWVPVEFTLLAHKDESGKVIYFSTVARRSSVLQIQEEVRRSRVFLRRTMQVQEEERQKIAQELHDGIGQSLYSILLGLQYVQSIVKEDRNKQLVQKWIDELHKTLSIVKFFAVQLRPHTLDQLGLAAAIDQLIQGSRGFHKHMNMRLISNLEPDERFCEELEICLYRIAQEAVHNVIKHASARSVDIELKRTERLVSLSVRDDGKGFLRERVKAGLGLRHMEERAKAAGGTFVAVSALSAGTRIYVEIPLEWGGSFDKNTVG